MAFRDRVVVYRVELRGGDSDTLVSITSVEKTKGGGVQLSLGAGSAIEGSTV